MAEKWVEKPLTPVPAKVREVMSGGSRFGIRPLSKAASKRLYDAVRRMCHQPEK